MTAIIWYVQLVHYPTFEFVAVENFEAFHKQHSRRTTSLVLVPMLLEITSALGLVWFAFSTSSLFLVGLSLLTWALTFFVSVPLHTRLSRGHDPYVLDKLVSTNWLRTLTWTLKLVWCGGALMTH